MSSQPQCVHKYCCLVLFLTVSLFISNSPSFLSQVTFLCFFSIWGIVHPGFTCLFPTDKFTSISSFAFGSIWTLISNSLLSYCVIKEDVFNHPRARRSHTTRIHFFLPCFDTLGGGSLLQLSLGEGPPCSPSPVCRLSNILMIVCTVDYEILHIISVLCWGSLFRNCSKCADAVFCILPNLCPPLIVGDSKVLFWS